MKKSHPFWTLMTESREVHFKSLRYLVGLPGFEPGTSCTPSKRASQAAPQPECISLAPRCKYAL